MIAQELPVYKDLKQLLVKLRKAIVNFPRTDRFTIGERLINLTLDCLENIQLANSMVNQRWYYLTKVLAKFGTIGTLIDVCNTEKIISVKTAATLLEISGKINKQITGWKQRSQS